jgi:hypothetical protein
MVASTLSVFSGRHVHHQHAHVRLPDTMAPGIAVDRTEVTPRPFIEVTPRPATTTTPTRAAAVTTGSDCTFIDAKGFKHYRRECLDRRDPMVGPDIAADPFTKTKP